MDTGKSSGLRSGFRSRLTGRPDMIENLGKLPPQATDLEEAVLGALMLEKDALTTVIDILKAESFYRENHKEIYKAIVQLFNNSEPVDLLTVTNQLRKNGKLEFVGGAYYITELTTRVNSAANIEFHARIISEQSIKRELIRIASEIQHDAYEDTTDVFNLLDRTEQALFEVSESNIRKNYSDMRTIMAEAIAELEAKKDHKDGLTGIPSGFNFYSKEHFRKVPKIGSLLIYFIKELVVASIKVAYDVVTPKFIMKPAVIAFPLDAESDLEITILASLISLTPGTLSLDVTDDRKILYVHAMYIRNGNLEELKQEIKNGFERRILEITR
jgi:multisubunit Na+/H+ antiporter MnhE subunit